MAITDQERTAMISPIEAMSKAEYDALWREKINAQRAQLKGGAPGTVKTALAKIASLFQAKIQGIYTPGQFPGKYASRPLILDVSHYDNVNWLALKDRIAGAWVKIGEADDTYKTNPDSAIDTAAMGNIQGLADIRAFCGIYLFLNTAYFVQNSHTETELNNWDNENNDTIWANNILKNDPNVRTVVKGLTIGDAWTTDANALKSAKFRRVHAIAIDVERWWLWYSDWFKNGNNAKRIDPNGFWIEFVTRKTVERLQRLMNRGFLPQIPMVIYSAAWVMDYSPALVTRTSFYDSWVAHWYWGAGKIVTTIEEFVSKYLTSIPDTWNQKEFGKVVRFRQLSGERYYIPEVVSSTQGNQISTDFNVFWGTIDQLKSWATRWDDWDNGTTPPPPPDNPPDVPPGTDITGLIATANQILEIAQGIDNRLKNAGNGFLNKQ